MLGGRCPSINSKLMRLQIYDKYNETCTCSCIIQLPQFTVKE